MLLANRVVLVTGSSRGIGRAIAQRLAQEGASVIVNASTSAVAGKRISHKLPVLNGQRHTFVRADVGRPRDVRRMMQTIRQRYGRLDMLVNNAGVTRFIDHRRINQLTIDLFDQIYRVNVRGAFLCIQAGHALLRKAPDPLVVNIASIASVTAAGSNVAYCAMKAALANMTKSLARALAPEIRVNAISPGLTDTALMQGWKTYRAEQLRRTPLRRLGNGEDVAGAVVALATSLPYVTGHNLVVDGGRVLN